MSDFRLHLIIHRNESHKASVNRVAGGHRYQTGTLWQEIPESKTLDAKI